MSSEQSDSKSEVTTDFSKYSKGRRYFDLPLPGGGKFRVQSVRRSEVLSKMVNLPPVRQLDALITLAVVDENGDTIWACSEESFATNLDDMDYQVYEAMLEAVKAFCTNSIDYEELAKNYDQTRNG